MKEKILIAIVALFAFANVALFASAKNPDPIPGSGGGSADPQVINPCKVGGPGATSCENTLALNIMEFGGSHSCNVKCGPGTYACCNEIECHCEPDSRVY